jgi:hypothetical protein
MPGRISEKAGHNQFRSVVIKIGMETDKGAGNHWIPGTLFHSEDARIAIVKSDRVTSRRCHFGSVCCALSALLFLSTVGCGPYPPSIETKEDIRQLPLNTKWVHARSLPDDAIPELSRIPFLNGLDYTAGYARNDFTTGFKPWEAAITDRGLAKLSEVKLPKLEYLHLGYCSHITNAGLAHVAKIKSVRWLSLCGSSQISDDGLQNLVGMKKLSALDLRHCDGITDRGLETLQEMTNLREIMLGGCKNLTPGAIAALKIALPKSKVDLREE